MQAQQIHQRLEKMTLPLSKVNINIQIQGVFNPPQQWKSTDEANPNLFTYSCKFMKVQAVSGKIIPRQQTEKQIRELAEQAAKKKGGKKQSKQDPAQQQKLRKLKELQLEQQKKRIQQWEKLTQEQKIYATAEDPYKTFSLKFDKKSHSFEASANTLVIFQERVLQDKGEWIYLFKYPNVSEDEIAKLKKGKTKGLNLNDLNPLVTRAWIDYTKLSQHNVTSILVRARLHQIDQVADSPKPNLDKTYILIKINLSHPISKEPDISEPTIAQLIKPPPPDVPPAQDVEAINELKKQIKLALESISMQYSTMFWKELNFVEQQRNVNALATTKKAELLKRKEQFLYDFNMSGKYKILKERMKKVIVNVCKFKYTNQLSQYTTFTGVTTEAKDQFYSEIYNFLVSTTQQTLQSLIENKKEQLKQTTVPNLQNRIQDIEKYITQRIEEQFEQKIVRIATEYQQLKQTQQAQEVFLRAFEIQPQNLQLKFAYAKFCLRNKIGSPFPAKIIQNIYECLRYDTQSRQLRFLYLILLLSTKKKPEIRQSWIILKKLIQQDPDNNEYYLLASYLFTLLGEEQLSEKYQKFTERLILRKNGHLNEKRNHHKSPIVSQLPSLKHMCSYDLALKSSQKDHLWLKLVSLLSNYNMYNLVEGIINKMTNKQLDELLTTLIKIEIFKGNTKTALQKGLELAERRPSLEVIELITGLTLQSKNYEICEQYLKKAFKYKQSARNHVLYLRLAYVNFQFAKYANSKACLVKLLKMVPNHSLAWLKLGASELCLGDYETSLNCLRQANILNIENSQVWLKLCENYIKQSKFNIANQCLVNYLKLETENARVSKRKLSFGPLEKIQVLIRQSNRTSDAQKSISSKIYKMIEQFAQS